MSGCWWNGYLVVFLSCFLVVNTKLDLKSTLKLAHCRASCLFKIKMFNLTDATCSTTPACKQCWDTCKSLLKDSTNLHYCTKPSCDVGCQEACRYFQMSPSMIRPPVVLSHHEETLTITSDEVRWPPLTAGTPPAVYIVLNQGEAVRQTLDSRVKPPPGLLEEIRVLRVDWRGQATVLGPRLETSLARLRTVLRSLGLPQPPSTSLAQASNLPLDWRLQLESMVAAESLVTAQISWNSSQLITPTAAVSQLTYLVTWEVEDGVLMGNLLTNSTKATLSLRPNTVYKIQVSVVNGNGDIHSEPLLLDTHEALTTTLTSDTSRSATEVSSQSPTMASMAYNMLAPATAVDSLALAVAVLTSAAMFLVLVTAWRCRHHFSLPHSHLVVEDQQSPSLYRVFSPAVRLVGERKNIPPDMYTSTDNLLQQ